MFVGHYSVSFALNSDKNRIPLWILFIAVQLVDILWGTFVLLGIEKLRIVPGITAASPLDLYYMPYTHSLLAALSWSAIAFVVYRFVSDSVSLSGAPMIVALAVLSHWILDFIVHRPDLSIYDDSFKVGLGLWNYKYLAFALEVAILIGAIILYLRRNSGFSKRRKYGVISFGVFLILIHSIGTFVSRPLSSDRRVAATNLILYSVFAGLAYLVERPREVAA